MAIAQIEVVENGQIVNNNEELSVGTASDVFIDLQCIGDTMNVIWFRIMGLNFSFNQTVTSYDPLTGLLRVFIAFLQDPANLVDGRVSLSCVRNSRVTNIMITPGENKCTCTQSIMF